MLVERVLTPAADIFSPAAHLIRRQGGTFSSRRRRKWADSLLLVESIPQSLRDSSLYTREPLKCWILACLATILQLLISLPLTREVARLAVTVGEKRYVNFAVIYVAVPWDAEDVIPYKLNDSSPFSAAGASPRPTDENTDLELFFVLMLKTPPSRRSRATSPKWEADMADSLDILILGTIYCFLITIPQSACGCQLPLHKGAFKVRDFGSFIDFGLWANSIRVGHRNI